MQKSELPCRKRQGYGWICPLIRYFLLLISVLLVPVSSVAAQPQYLFVPAQYGECINTFTVRVMVAASNSGAAWGEFEGSRVAVVRHGANPLSCWLDLKQWDAQGRLEETKRLNCLFANPLEGG
jgi:hypothetical protein